MRVISGSARGHKLAAPKGIKTRPTGDRMKEDLFNILGSEVCGSRFLDLFCGSGAIGIEAISRGAAHAVFVDSSKDAVDSVKANLIKTRLDGYAEVLRLTYKQSLERLQRNSFNIIFLDPPYENSKYNFKDLSVLLSNGGTVILECLKDIITPDFGDLILYRQKVYTKMQFMFFSREESL